MSVTWLVAVALLEGIRLPAVLLQQIPAVAMALAVEVGIQSKFALEFNLMIGSSTCTHTLPAVPRWWLSTQGWWNLIRLCAKLVGAQCHTGRLVRKEKLFCCTVSLISTVRSPANQMS